MPQAAGNIKGRKGARTWRQKLAQAGEDCAARLFSRRGAQIVARNWRAGRYAEIDLIARERDGTLVFVEVKTRNQSGDGSGFPSAGFDAIHFHKQQKIVTSARIYVSQHEYGETPVRLDVVVVEFAVPADSALEDPLPEPHVIHVADAIQL